jgi:hypothetical protein
VSGSAIPAAQLVLRELLEAAKPLEDVPVLVGKPDPLPAEFIAFFEATSQRDFGPIGGGKLNEMVELTLVVDVAEATGSDFAPSEARAWEIFADVEAVIRSDLSLADTWFFDHVSKVRKEYFRVDKRRGCRIFLTLSGKARI